MPILAYSAGAELTFFSYREPLTLPAYRLRGTRGEACLVVWCKFCLTWHIHGTGEKFGSGDGHRVSHCSGFPLGKQAKSEYLRCGYYLREIGDATKEVCRDLKRKRHRGVS